MAFLFHRTRRGLTTTMFFQSGWHRRTHDGSALCLERAGYLGHKLRVRTRLSVCRVRGPKIPRRFGAFLNLYISADIFTSPHFHAEV